MRIEFRIKVACACFAMSATWIAVALATLSSSSDITRIFVSGYQVDPNVATQDFLQARQQLKYTTTIAIAVAAGLSGLITVWILQTYERTLIRPILAIQRLADGDTGFRYRRADLDPALRSAHDPIAKLLYEASRVSALIERSSDEATVHPNKASRHKPLFGGQRATKGQTRAKPRPSPQAK